MQRRCTLPHVASFGLPFCQKTACIHQGLGAHSAENLAENCCGTCLIYQVSLLLIIIIIIVTMKNFNRCSSRGHHGSKRHKLAQHAHSRGSHSTHWLTHLHQHQHSYNHVVWSASSAIIDFGIKCYNVICLCGFCYIRGHWHGDVAIKLLDMGNDSDNQDQLAAFRLEVRTTILLLICNCTMTSAKEEKAQMGPVVTCMLPKGGWRFCLPPVWNLRAVSLILLFYIYISSLVLLPSPVILSVFSFSAFGPFSWPLFPKPPFLKGGLFLVFLVLVFGEEMSTLVSGMCSICCNMSLLQSSKQTAVLQENGFIVLSGNVQLSPRSSVTCELDLWFQALLKKCDVKCVCK